MAAPPPSSLTTPDDLLPTAADFADDFDTLDGVPGGGGPAGAAGGGFGDEGALDDEELVYAVTSWTHTWRGSEFGPRPIH